MNIPADGVVITASELSTDESAITGETDAMPKAELEMCLKERDENSFKYSQIVEN